MDTNLCFSVRYIIQGYNETNHNSLAALVTICHDFMSRLPPLFGSITIVIKIQIYCNMWENMIKNCYQGTYNHHFYMDTYIWLEITSYVYEYEPLSTVFSVFNTLVSQNITSMSLFLLQGTYHYSSFVMFY